MSLIAPLSAQSLAKIATGLCDDTLTCVLRAWDFGYKTSLDCKGASSLINKGKPIVLSPAMNTAMWEHPLTKSQLETIEAFGNSNDGTAATSLVKVVGPQVKTLACGEVGNGAMASPIDIVKVTKDQLADCTVR